jgi:long-chain acyl-CoA synthetase
VRGEFGVRWWSYRRLHDEAVHMAAVLRRQGISSGDRIVLWAPNCPEWVSVLLGAALRGITVVPADENASPGYVKLLAEQVCASMVVHGPDQDVSCIEVATRGLFGDQAGVASDDADDLTVPVGPDDPALIMFTSGTTQQPKGVILTHRNVLAPVSQFRRWRWLLRARPLRILVLAPLSHSQGLILGIGLPLSLGLTVLYTQAVDPPHLIRTIRDNRVALLSTVPRLLHVLAATLRQMPAGPSGATLEAQVSARGPGLRQRLYQARHVHSLLGRQFRVVLVGGAVLPAPDEQFWRQSGCLVVQGYGLTETAAIVSVNLNFAGSAGSIGRPLLNQTIELAEDGEILVRGPNVSPGYFGGPPDTAVSSDGFLHTGDLARRDADNRLYFLGRKKDTIVTGEGFNIYPLDVEGVLNQQPGLRDAVVLGLRRDGHEEVHAVLLLQPGAEPAAIVRQANATLEPHQVIRGWTRWHEADFPRTALLKVKREQVAAVVHNAETTTEVRGQDDAPPTLDSIQATHDRNRRLQLLAHYLVDVDVDASPEQPGADGVRLGADLGLSSLDIVELLTHVEVLVGMPFGEISVPQGARLADLAQIARAQHGSGSTSPLPVREPAWSGSPLGRLVRSVSQPLLINAWAAGCARVVADYPPGGFDSGQPLILAAAPHRHWLDAFAIYAALPRRVRRRLAVVTNRDFHERFSPGPHITPAERRLVGLGYYLLLPLVFNFAIVPNFGTTRAGLYDMARLLDQGRNLLTFPKGLFLGPEDARRHDPGVAVLALQTQLPILPIWLEGNDDFRLRPPRNPRPVTVRFGEPIDVAPGLTPGDVVDRLEAAFKRLR